MTDINKEYEKEYYDEYRNNYYNPDDDDGEPGINLNWKRIQKGFHSVAENDTETAETITGMQSVLGTLSEDVDTLSEDVDTLKTDVDEIKESMLQIGFVTPEMFGAIGDGSHDDTEAINDCIAAAEEYGCKVLLVSMYAVSSTIELLQKTYIVGANFNSCGLIMISDNDSVIKLQKYKVVSGNTVTVSEAFTTIENITINGNNRVQDAVLVNVAYCNIKYCLIKGASNSGIKLSGTYCNVINNNMIYGGDYAIICDFNKLRDQAAQNSTTITDNKILFCEKYAFVIGGGDSWLIERNTIEMAKYGVGIFTGFHTLKFSCNYLENDSKWSKNIIESNDSFYIRAMLIFGYTLDNQMLAGTVGESAIVENNFVNMDGAAEGNIIPDGYEDISTFILATGIKYLTINNNYHSTNNGRHLLCFGSRRANSIVDNVRLFQNDNFAPVRMLGSLHSDLAARPYVKNDDCVKYNYYNDVEISDSGGAMPITEDTSSKFFGNKVYQTTSTNQYARIEIPASKYSDLASKTVLIGFYALLPTGVTSVEFYFSTGITSGIISVDNSIIKRDEWCFVGMAANVPATINDQLTFHFKFTNPQNKIIKMSKLVLVESGVVPEECLARL